MFSGSLTGGSGGGHGGSGGRGAGIYTVGQGYDSLYTPVQYGSPGGYGTLRGMCKGYCHFISIFVKFIHLNWVSD